MADKRSKQAIKAVAKEKAEKQTPPSRKDKHIYSVYLSADTYKRLKARHGRDTSRIINDLIDSYLEAVDKKGK